VIHILCRLTFTVLACAVVAGCAEDLHSDRHGSGYSQGSQEMGPRQSGRSYRFDEHRQYTDRYNDPYGQGGRY
jgi:hypothetical protein